MRLTESYDLFAELEFPMDVERLIDEVGAQLIEAPNGTSESIGEILKRGDMTPVDSVDDAYTRLLGNVSDAYIGRKFYDDRSSNPHWYEDVSF